jgi:hypothetical protein
MSAALFPLYTLAQIALTIWGARLYVSPRSLPLLLAVLVSAGLIYDNLIIAIGAQVGIGSTLELLSLPRFVIHGLLTPALLLTGHDFAQRAGIRWVQSPSVTRFAWGVTLVLVAAGMVQGVLTIHLQPACIDGIVRYAERISDTQVCPGVVYSDLNARGLPPLASIVTIVIVAIQGGMVGRRMGIWALLAGAVVMFIGAAVPASRVGPVVANGAEAVLFLGVFWTEHLMQRRTVAASNTVTVQPAS